MNWDRRRFATLLGLFAAGGWAPAILAKEGWKRRPVLAASKDHDAQEHAEGREGRSAPAEAKPKSAEHRALASPDAIWADLLEGNKRFVTGKTSPRELLHRREELAQGQHPQVIVLTCSDSRVSPELLFDKSLGDLFVVRTAGNVADPVALGSIEYAAEHLHAQVLLVLGHEKCGAVAAAASGEKMPTPNLEAIVTKINPALARVKGWAEGDKFLRLAEEANVHQSASDLLLNSSVVREEVAAGKLTIIKALYQLRTGEVTRLLG